VGYAARLPHGVIIGDTVSTGLENLSDEEKLSLAIEYQRHGAVMPEILRQFLRSQGLLDLVLNPKGKHEKD
jgi:hypothetical protein